MLAHVDAFTAIEMESKNVARAVAAEADLPRAGGFSEKDRHAGKDPLQRALQWPDSDLDTEVLPEKDVVLEVNGHATEFQMKHGHKLALNVIGNAGKCFGFGSSRAQHWNWHFDSDLTVKKVATNHAREGAIKQAFKGVNLVG
jgi:hypothetical protein